MTLQELKATLLKRQQDREADPPRTPPACVPQVRLDNTSRGQRSASVEEGHLPALEPHKTTQK
jgi:hypothetical protein